MKQTSPRICSPTATKLLTVLIVLFACSLEGITFAQSNNSAYSGIFTYHNDNSRTGQNLNETALTPATVNTNTFGKLFSYSVDGLGFGSPLYIAGVNIPGRGLHDVVFTATEHDTVYAFDANGLTNGPLWQVSFINPGAGVTPIPCGDTGECGDIPGEIGVTSTPVIDPTNGTLYVVAATKENTTNYVQRLHALDIATGAEKFGGPIVIGGSVPGTGMGSVGGQVSFDALRESQRTALLLANGIVYFAFSSHGDVEPYFGWVMGYGATNLQQVLLFNDSPNGNKGGIWMNGDGLACDAAGNLYAISGDGVLDANTGGSDYGDCFLKISPAGNVLDYFSPTVQGNLLAGDLDLGSGGVLLLPNQAGPHAHEAISAGKNATIYVVDRDNMGQYHTNGDQVVQSLVNVFSSNGGNEGGNFSSPVYFNGSVYFCAVQNPLDAFHVTNGLLSTNPTSQSSATFGERGGTMAISADGSTNGILWALESTGTLTPGVLHAYAPANLINELYNSNQAGSRDVLDSWWKFTTPLVVSGKVFVSSVNQLTAYGLLDTVPRISIVRPATVMQYPSSSNLTVTIIATATEATNGAAISQIDFFANGVQIGQTTFNPGTNLWHNPPQGTNTIFARVTDASGATNSSAPVIIVVGTKHSPLGDWEITVSGADKGVGFLTIADDFTANGYGLRLKTAGIDDLSGTWGFAAKGKWTGSFLEQLAGGGMNWTGTLAGTVTSLKKIKGKVSTPQAGVFHWSGVPVTTFPELSGIWTGIVVVAKGTKTPVNYSLAADASDPGVFNVTSTADTNTVLGELIVTSRNVMYGYVTANSEVVPLSGKYNAKRMEIALKGKDAARAKVSVKIVKQ